MSIEIRNGRILLGGRFHEGGLHASPDGLSLFPARASRRFDADGLLVLPGIVDCHGDAFERQLHPRPKTAFPVAMALVETDRQLAANGITTAFHGVTSSWEPGLRSTAQAGALMQAVDDLRPGLAVDTRFHLRHEAFNLDAEDVTLRWLSSGAVGALAFNDHVPGALKRREPGLQAREIERTGLGETGYFARLDALAAREAEVRPSLERLAAAARQAGVPMLSHDDRSPDDRRWFRAQGCLVSEFPMTVETAREAAAHGEHTVFGAPNVVRGGSHVGCPSAAEMAGAGLCTILASDYYYPALPAAPFRLAADGVLPLEQAWSLVSANPAAALGLSDRGEIAEGRRADLVLVDASDPAGPRIVATMVAGRFVFLADAERLA